MDDQESIFPDPDILWSRIRESERTAPSDRPVVLVIEDDASSRMLMRYSVRDIVRTDAASTVADALRMAEAVPYDGLLVDLRLPDGEGTELVKKLRERTPYWGVPMVAVTAHSLPEGSGHFLDAGFDAYVAKPFEQDDLRTLVRHLIVDSDEAVDKGRKLVRRDSKKNSRPAAGENSDDSKSSRRSAPATQRLDVLPDS